MKKMRGKARIRNGSHIAMILKLEILVKPLRRRATKWKGRQSFRHVIALLEPFSASIIAQKPNKTHSAQSK
jgi:hypothetical protein